MVEHLEFVSVREVMSDLLRNPAMSGLTLEDTVHYTLDFIGKMGLPHLDEERMIQLSISGYRAVLPCDFIQVRQVKDCTSGTCLRYNTDTFMNDNPDIRNTGDNTYSIQGSIIYVTFKEGNIELSYKASRVDEDGLPLIPMNPKFRIALELYIKLQKFTIKLETSTDWQSYKMNMGILNNLNQEYCFAAAQCNSAFTIPSVDEMQSITGMWNQLLVKYNEHSRGFRNLGAQEWRKTH